MAQRPHASPSYTGPILQGCVSIPECCVSTPSVYVAFVSARQSDAFCHHACRCNRLVWLRAHCPQARNPMQCQQRPPMCNSHMDVHCSSSSRVCDVCVFTATSPHLARAVLPSVTHWAHADRRNQPCCLAVFRIQLSDLWPTLPVVQHPQRSPECDVPPCRVCSQRCYLEIMYVSGYALESQAQETIACLGNPSQCDTSWHTATAAHEGCIAVCRVSY